MPIFQKPLKLFDEPYEKVTADTIIRSPSPGTAEGLKIWGAISNTRSFDERGFTSNSAKMWGKAHPPPVPPALRVIPYQDIMSQPSP